MTECFFGLGYEKMGVFLDPFFMENPEVWVEQATSTRPMERLLRVI